MRLSSVLLVSLVSSVLQLSCTAEYFKTANDLSKTKATVYFKDGTKKEGLLTILLENGVEVYNASLSFIPAGSQTEERLDFADVAAYVVNGTTYVAKHINLYTAGINRGLFVKRLSDEKAKIQFFELEQQRKSNDTGDDRSLYFISVPAYSSTELIELHSALLVPSFETKMSAFVSDCPELAEKTRNKEKGFSYSFLSAEATKVEVMKRIVSAYNNCVTK
jgi:hypothetical protein